MSQDEYYLRFSYCPGIGPQRFLSVIRYFKNIKNAWEGSKEDYIKCGIGDKTYDSFDKFRNVLEKENRLLLSEIEAKNIDFISQVSKTFPKSLLKLVNPPIGIFARGNTKLLNERLLFSVVGSRKSTLYGRQITEKFVADLVDSQMCIVSGLALGIDSVAHEATLKNKGKTIAVLGNGVDIPYPQENIDLYRRIINQNSLIISEYPPGTWPNRGSFPARNRIIASLSMGVLVTEAARSSGSLITAKLANQVGVPVFAIPGPVTSLQSQGTLYLLQKYAKLAINSDEILDYYQLRSDRSDIGKRVLQTNIPDSAKKLLGILSQEPMSINALCKTSNLEVNEVTRLISFLEIKGLVRNDGLGSYVVVI